MHPRQCSNDPGFFNVLPAGVTVWNRSENNHGLKHTKPPDHAHRKMHDNCQVPLSASAPRPQHVVTVRNRSGTDIVVSIEAHTKPASIVQYSDIQATQWQESRQLVRDNQHVDFGVHGLEPLTGAGRGQLAYLNAAVEVQMVGSTSQVVIQFLDYVEVECS